MTFTLEDLLPDDQQLRTIQPHETVQHVINVMHQHDFNQLPVVDVDGLTSLGQVVTFEGIIQAMQSFGAGIHALQVRDVALNVRTYASDADLLATLDDIHRNNFALIAEEKKLTGIVTTADTTEFFRKYAQDLMLIEGIESRIKEAIKARYSSDSAGLKTAIDTVTDRTAEIRRKLPGAIRAYCGKSGLDAPKSGTDVDAIAEAERKLGLSPTEKKFEHLSFDEFIQVLLRHENAPRLSLSKDVAELKALLEQVRDARNKLAHFRGELKAEERRAIQIAATWLERNLPSPPEEPPPAPATATSPPPSPALSQREKDEPEPRGSYAELAKFLESQADTMTSLPLSFQDIERTLGKKLPPSAYEYRAWWSNDPTKPQSSAWLDEGWRTTSLSMTDQRLTFVRTNDREDAYISFFANLNTALEQRKEFPLQGTSPQGQSWMVVASLDWSGPYSATIIAAFARRKRFRVELYLDSGEKEKNKRRFDDLFARKGIIESAIGEPLDWERLDEKRACRVAVYTKANIHADKSNPVLLEWAVRHVLDFYRAFQIEFLAGPTS